MNPETASSIAIIVTAVCAVGGLIIAGLGLRTWRQELRGRAEYELARRVMILVYKVRDGLEFVQHPTVYVTEWQTRPGRDESKQEMEEQDLQYAYNMRLKTPNDARRELHVELLEVEAIWGDVLKAVARRLSQVYAELAVTAMMYVETRSGDHKRLGYSAEDKRRFWEVVFNVGEPGAKFRRELNEAIQGF